jgi:hypothetical protein
VLRLELRGANVRAPREILERKIQATTVAQNAFLRALSETGRKSPSWHSPGSTAGRIEDCESCPAEGPSNRRCLNEFAERAGTAR